MEFINAEDLIEKANNTLGEFCNEFGQKRKELAKLSRAPKRGILFTYNPEKGNTWAINEGGGTEIQYHIALDIEKKRIVYGLGFNTQYVPYSNEMAMVDYMQPFMDGFLKNEVNIKKLLPHYDFIYGDIEQLRKPENNRYTLFGVSLNIEKKEEGYSIEDKTFDQMIRDLKAQFEPYKIIFEEKNRTKGIDVNINMIIDILNQKGQIILQGPPGTGKTYTAKDIAEQVIFSKISKNKREQKEKLESSDQFKLIQFHPAYSYEDFVRGIVAKTKDTSIYYETENKIFAKFAGEAYKNWSDLNKKTEIVSKERWVQNILDDFKEYISDELDSKEEKIMLTEKTYIKRITETSIRYNSDAWEIDGGVPFSDIIKMYLADTKTRRQVKDNPELTKTAKSLSSYWLKVLELFKKYISDRNLIYQENKVEVKEKKYVLIIDEINRANLPVVLGELIYALEYREEKIESMYSIEEDNTLIIPPNLLIIGTMNTSDRSVGHIDYAIRRRFAFIDVLPKVLNEPTIEFELELFKKVSSLFIQNFDEYAANNTVKLKISEHLSEEFRPEDVWLGHSYFIIKNGSDFNLRRKYEIIPILKEYLKDGILKQSAENIINAL